MKAHVKSPFDMRCLSIHIFFEVRNCLVDGERQTVYTEDSLIYCQGLSVDLFNIPERYNALVEQDRAAIAKKLGVSLIDVAVISHDEYAHVMGIDNLRFNREKSCSFNLPVNKPNLE